jgi:hypothetical protein
MVLFDDIVVYSKTWERHLLDLAEVFDRLRTKNITLNFRKCEFAKEELIYLGFVVNKDGLKPNPKKVAAVADFPQPKDVAELRQFLGMASQFRRFICDYAKIGRPLTELLKVGSGRKKDVTSLTQEWGEEQTKAFDTLKLRLSRVALLRFPDLTKSLIVTTDASNYAIGAMLSQKDDHGVEHPIEFASRLLADAETRYHTTEREGVVMFAVEKFRHYLHGIPFLVRTDHKALDFIFKNQDAKGRLGRWAVILSEFDYTVQHKPGVLNEVADALSRSPVGPAQEGVGDGMEIAYPLVQAITATAEDTPLQDFRQVLKDLKQHGKRIQVSEWAKAIEHDALFGHMVWWLHSRVMPDDQHMVRWVAQGDREYTLLDAVLYRMETRMEAGKKVSRPMIVVPTVFRDVVTLHYHASETEGGHMAVAKTYAKVRDHFWWPGMYTRIRQLVNTCVVCQSTRDLPSDTMILGRLKPESEFEVIGMDLLALPTSDEGYEYVLVVVDHFTRFAWARPVKDKTMDTILKAYTDISMPFNKPKTLVSDNGPEFKNTRMEGYCLAFGIHQHFVIPYHPQSDGVVERFNRTLLSLLRAYVEDNTTDWAKHLQKLCAAYNSTPHKTNGLSPYHLMYKMRAGQNLVDIPREQADASPNEWDLGDSIPR